MARRTSSKHGAVLAEGFAEGGLEVLDEVCGEGSISHDQIMGDQNVGGVKRTIETDREHASRAACPASYPPLGRVLRLEREDQRG